MIIGYWDPWGNLAGHLKAFRCVVDSAAMSMP